jgi:hypothetical protein
MFVAYGEYTITVYEREKDRWRAKVRRNDGNKIKILVTPNMELDEGESSHDFLTLLDALEDMKKGIDGGGMK